MTRDANSAWRCGLLPLDSSGRAWKDSLIDLRRSATERFRLLLLRNPWGKRNGRATGCVEIKVGCLVLPKFFTKSFYNAARPSCRHRHAIGSRRLHSPRAAIGARLVDSSSCWRKRPDVAAAVGNKRSNDDDGRFWIQLPDFRQRFRTVDLCRVKNGQLKERNVLKERTAAESAADAEAAAVDDDWLAEIPGAARAHDHASKAPSKKKKKSKKKHKLIVQDLSKNR